MKDKYLLSNNLIKKKSDICGSLVEELKLIEKEITNLPRFSRLKSDILTHKEKENSVLSFILQEYERIICHNSIKKIQNKYGKDMVSAWIYDGFQIKTKDIKIINEILDLINEPIVRNETMNDIMCDNKRIKFIAKSFKDKLSALTFINPLRTVEEIRKQFEEKIAMCCNSLGTALQGKHNNPNSYEAVKAEFEKTHFKVINKSLFITIDYEVDKLESPFIPNSKKDFQTSCEHLAYTKFVDIFDKNGNVTDTMQKQCNFLNDWFIDPTMKTKKGFGIYPNEVNMPKDYFNMWLPFAMESYETDKDFIVDQADIDFVDNQHFHLCGENQQSFEYVENWIAHMIQFPEKKSTALVFRGQEGLGKGGLCEILLPTITGKRKFFVTSDIGEVFGNFNPMMEQAFLVNLDELSLKDIGTFEGRFKTLVTSENLTINKKNCGQFQTSSYHRIMITSNKEIPIQSDVGDRRKYMIHSSAKYKGNFNHFKRYFSIIKNKNYVKYLYDRYKSRPISDFNPEDMPITDYQQDLQDSFINPIDLWLKYYVSKNINKESVTLTGAQIFERVNEYLKSLGMIKYDTNAIKIGMHLSTLKLSGLTKIEKSNSKCRIFNFKLLKEELKIVNENENLKIDLE